VRDEDGNRHLAEFGWPMRSAESGSQSDVNEWQKSGNQTGALKGHLWVALSKPSVLSKVVIYAGNAIHNRPNGIFLKRLGVD
jgi:hypothetical protein